MKNQTCLSRWMEKYLPITAQQCVEDTIYSEDRVLQIINHSLIKWLGLRPKILKKFGLTLGRPVRFAGLVILENVYEETVLSINSRNCSLCQFSASFTIDARSNLCVYCPIMKATGSSCEDCWQIFRRDFNPLPMIQLLIKTRKVYLNAKESTID